MITLTPGKYRSLTLLAGKNNRFSMLAIDQRPPIQGLIAEKKGDSHASDADVSAVKRVLLESLQRCADSVLADPIFSMNDTLLHLQRDKGLIVTLEHAIFDEKPLGRLSRNIPEWSVNKIKGIGGNGVKALVWLRPDQDPDTLEKQLDFVEQIGIACELYDIPFILEPLVYPFPNEAGHTRAYVEQADKRSAHVLESLRILADRPPIRLPRRG